MMIRESIRIVRASYSSASMSGIMNVTLPILPPLLSVPQLRTNSIRWHTLSAILVR